MGKRAISLDEHLIVLRHDGRERLGWVGVINDRTSPRPVNRAMFHEDWAPGTKEGPAPTPLCEVQDEQVVQDLGTFASFWDDASNIAWLERLGELPDVSALRLVRAVAIARKAFRPHPVQAPDPMMLVDRAHQVHGSDPAHWPAPALSALVSVAGGEARRARLEIAARRRWSEQIAQYLEFTQPARPAGDAPPPVAARSVRP